MSAAPALPGLLASLAPLLDHYGYLAVGGLVFLEDFGVPVPGETVLIAAAVYAGAGRLSWPLVFLVGVLAAVLGDNVGYLIGRAGGRPLVLRFGRSVRFTEERLDHAEAFFRRHGGKIIVVARFIEGLRQANGIVAGVTRLHWLRFLFFNAIGAILWVGVWTSLGDLAGNHITVIYRDITRYSLLLATVALMAIVAVAVRHRRRRGRSPGAGAAGDGRTGVPAGRGAD